MVEMKDMAQARQKAGYACQEQVKQTNYWWDDSAPGVSHAGIAQNTVSSRGFQYPIRRPADVSTPRSSHSNSSGFLQQVNLPSCVNSVLC